MPDVEIVAVGAELLLGRRVETNSHTIQKALKRIGLAVRFGSVVSDRLEDVAHVLATALGRSEVVIVTGGLGPTADDVTRAAIARAAGVGLAERADAMAQIEAFFARVQRPMPPSNRLQALMPVGAQVLENRCGTAPGVALETRGRQLFALPGVPFEMEAMLAAEVLPRLAQRFPAPPLAEKTLHLFGLAEASAGEQIRDLMEAPPPPEVAITVHDGVIAVAITAPADHAARVDAIAAEVRARFRDRIFGEDQESRLEAVVGRLLLERRVTIATAESCTGGLLAAELTRVPGISEVFLEGAVTYSNAAKTRLLGVPAALIEQHGAVSAEVARAMAVGIARASGAAIGVGITGIAGPGGGSPEKPVGLVFVALANGSGGTLRELHLAGDRDAVRRRSVQAALDLIRRELLGREG